MLIDNQRLVETPEGVVLSIRLAGVVPRFAAFFIDMLIRIAVYIVAAIALNMIFSDGVAGGLFFIFFFLLEWFYYIIFEVYKQGQTPGKKSMKIKVLHANGTPVDWQASMIRNFLRAVDFLPFFYGLGAIFVIFNKDFARLGDIAANTIVVHAEDHQVFKVIPDAKAKAPNISLLPDEQNAIVSFAARADKLSIHRQTELAEILTPLHDDKAEESIKHLHQYANFYAGGAKS